jgi:hypothetical protein
VTAAGHVAVVTMNHDLWHLPAAAQRGTIVAEAAVEPKGNSAVTTTSTSTSTSAVAATSSPNKTRRSAVRSHLRFAGHFVEMVVAMFVGMVALEPLWSFVAPGAIVRADAHALVMATNMTIGMALWMKIRRHSWPRIAEMSAAMYLPFVVLLVPYWLGAISADALTTAGHFLMLPVMLAAMLWRRSEYYHHH